MARLTIIHDRNACLVVDQGWECENTNFMGQLDIVRLDKLYAMFIGIIIDVFQLFQNARACFTVIIIY